MRFLKAFVIFMALVIAVGGGALAWGLAHHWNQMTRSAAPAAEVAPADSGYAAVDVATPSGMSFAQMETAGDRLLLRFTGPQGERIVVIDPRTGRVTGNIAVAPAAP